MKFFHILLVMLALLFGGVPAFANSSSQDRCGDLCVLYKHAHARKLHPTTKPLVCVNFTLPTAGAKVTLVVSRGKSLVIKDAKYVSAREGQFCYPRSRWLRAGGEPDKVFLCSKHRVTLPWKGVKIDTILSTRGTNPQAYACLRDPDGCGGRDNVAIPAGQLDR